MSDDMSIDLDRLPVLPIPLSSSGPWPTFSVSLEERRAIASGDTTALVMEVFPQVIQAPLIAGPPPLVRSSQPEKTVIASEPPQLLTIPMPVISLERPTSTAFPAASGSVRRIHSRRNF